MTDTLAGTGSLSTSLISLTCIFLSLSLTLFLFKTFTTPFNVIRRSGGELDGLDERFDGLVCGLLLLSCFFFIPHCLIWTSHFTPPLPARTPHPLPQIPFPLPPFYPNPGRRMVQGDELRCYSGRGLLLQGPLPHPCTHTQFPTPLVQYCVSHPPRNPFAFPTEKAPRPGQAIPHLPFCLPTWRDSGLPAVIPTGPFTWFPDSPSPVLRKYGEEEDQGLGPWCA